MLAAESEDPPRQALDSPAGILRPPASEGYDVPSSAEAVLRSE
jgi:hypothetical protein